MEFEVKPGKLGSIASDERELRDTLKGLSGELEKCRNNLSDCLSSSASSSISRSINNVRNRLETSADKIGIMGDKLNTIATMYSHTDSSIAGKVSTPEHVSEAKNYNADGSVKEAKQGDEDGESFGFGAGGGFRGENENTDGQMDEMDEEKLLSAFEKINKNSGEVLNSDEIKALATFFGWEKSVSELGEATTAGEWLEKYLSMSGKSIDVVKDSIDVLENLIDQYGSLEAREWLKGADTKALGEQLGDAKTLLDVLGSTVKSYNEGDGTPGDTLRHMSEEDYSELYKMFGVKGSGVAAANGITAMTLYAVGDSVSLATDGHRMTISEMANLLLKTGTTGVSSTYNSGVAWVDDKLETNFSEYFSMDVKNTNSFFEQNIDAATDKIMSMTDNRAGQVALAIAASPGVAAWSLAQSFMDIGYSGADKLKGNLGLSKDWNLIDCLRGEYN